MTRMSMRLAVASATAALLTIGLAPGAPARTTDVAPKPTICAMDTFGRDAGGHLTFRHVVNTQTTMVRRTTHKVGWTPLSWGMQSSESLRGRWERRTYLVPATDGRVRLVETFWTEGGHTLQVTVKKVLRWRVDTRAVVSQDSRLYNVAADGTLQRRIWNGRRIGKRMPLKVKVPGARAITVAETNYGEVIYLVDRKGRLHLVVPRSSSGSAVDHTVLRKSGYGHITGLKAASCSAPESAGSRGVVGLLQVNRAAGGARVQRHWSPTAENGRLGPPQRVNPSGWTWRYLG